MNSRVYDLKMYLFFLSFNKSCKLVPKSCQICLRTITDLTNELATLRYCGHQFHFTCLLYWLMENPSCAICRQKSLELKDLSDYNVKVTKTMPTRQIVAMADAWMRVNNYHPPYTPEKLVKVMGREILDRVKGFDNLAIFNHFFWPILSNFNSKNDSEWRAEIIRYLKMIEDIYHFATDLGKHLDARIVVDNMLRPRFNAKIVFPVPAVYAVADYVLRLRDKLEPPYAFTTLLGTYERFGVNKFYAFPFENEYHSRLLSHELAASWFGVERSKHVKDHDYVHTFVYYKGCHVDQSDEAKRKRRFLPLPYSRHL